MPIDANLAERLRRAAAVVALVGLAAPAHAAGWPPRSPIESPLRLVADAAMAGDPARALADLRVRPFARRVRRPIVMGGAIAVEVQAADAAVARRWSASALAGAGVAVVASGWDTWLLRAPPAAIGRLAELLPGLRSARLPWGRKPLTGAHVSEGVSALGGEALHCAGFAGQGAHVVVVDGAWHGVGAAVASGDLPNLVGKAPFQSSNPDDVHGTACAEVVADVAPGAALRLDSSETLAEMQAALPKWIGAGVHVASDSSGWPTGYSFGDGTGKLCEFVTKARAAGLQWVASAGNEGDHSMWVGGWHDANQDGWLDLKGGGFTLSGLKGDWVTLELDWDAYPLAAVDLDLWLCGGSVAPCAKIAVADGIQDGGQTPQEVIDHEFASTESISLRVRVKAGTPAPAAGLGVRVSVTGQASLSPSVQEGTIIDPAQCPQALAVGAVAVADWPAGPPVPYSSRGPTWDGRVKPDLVAPTGVATSVLDAFEGTSAACPHAAGVIAVHLARAGLGGPAAADAVVAAALPQGKVSPNNAFGHGALAFPDPPSACAPAGDAAAAPDTSVTPDAIADAAEVDQPGAGDGAAARADVDATRASSAPTVAASSSGCASRRPGDEPVAMPWAGALLGALLALRAVRRRADNCRAIRLSRGIQRAHHVRDG